MQVSYTTEKGAKIEITLVGTDVSVSVNGAAYGQLNREQDHPENGYVLRISGKPGMIGVPASALAAVKTLIAEKGRRVAEAYMATEEGRFGAAMMVHERNDDDGADRAERVWR